MRYAKPEIETVRPAARVIRSLFQKGFELIFDSIRFFATLTAYEADE